MTCIVGIKSPSKIVLAADSMMSDGWTESTLHQTKVFRAGPLAIGTTGSLRYLNILQYNLAPLLSKPSATVDEYMYGEFVSAAFKAFEDGRALETVDGVAAAPGSALIALHGRVFLFETNFALSEVDDGYSAVGNGGEIALGALHATRHIKNPKRRALLAIEAATHHSVGVGGSRIDILEVK